MFLGMPWEAWGFMAPFGIMLLCMMIEFNNAENRRRDDKEGIDHE